MPDVTRGHGLLEHFLAKQRARMAHRLLPPDRSGAILDIGCGSFPFFLTHTPFARRVGIDRFVADLAPQHPDYDPAVELFNFDIDHADRLPLDDATFNVVTMLAVYEHIRPERMILLLNEVHRVLKPGGIYILTTPSWWTEPILKTMAALRLVSHEEIDEHQPHASPASIRATLNQTRFAGRPVNIGSFELGMNTWAVVRK
jgi:SAM-dependent methyltransferase